MNLYMYLSDLKDQGLQERCASKTRYKLGLLCVHSLLCTQAVNRLLKKKDQPVLMKVMLLSSPYYSLMNKNS